MNEVPMKRHQAAGADARVEYRVDDPRLDRLLARATREFKSHPDDPRYYEAVKQFIDEADPQPSYR